MNCPVCKKECRPAYFTDRHSVTVMCSDDDHYFYHDTFQEKIRFDVKLFNENMKDFTTINYHTYDDKTVWWLVKISSSPADQIIGYGSNPISPEEAYQLVKRYHNLRAFS